MKKPPVRRSLKTLAGSEGARKSAAVVLEVLAGLRSTSEGCEALGIGAMRYYVLETRALQGLVAALEPRPRGKRVRPEDRVREIERENSRLGRELARTKALVRIAERTIGIPPAGGKISSQGKNRRRRPTERARRAVAILRAPVEGPKTEAKSASGPP